jgi:hypothetical protein
LQTALAAADMLALSQTNRTIGIPELVNETNEDDLGKGHEWATQVFKSHWNVNQPWDGRLSSQNAALLAVFGLGSYSTPVPVGTGGFKYTCVPLDNLTEGLEMPSTTFLQTVRQAGDFLLDNALIGMVCEEFGFKFTSGPGRENALMSSVWVGCGKYTTPSTIALMEATIEDLLNSGGAVTLTAGGVDYIATKRFLDLNFNFKNNIMLDQGFYPGSGLQNGANIRGRMRHGKRAIALQIAAEMEHDSAELANYLNQTEVTASILIEGAALGAVKHALEITIPRVIVKAAPIGDNNNILSITPDFAFLKHSTNGVLTIAVTTDVNNIGVVAT